MAGAEFAQLSTAFQAIKALLYKLKLQLWIRSYIFFDQETFLFNV